VASKVLGARRALRPALLLLVEGVGLQTIPLHLWDLVDHLLEGVASRDENGKDIFRLHSRSNPFR
jgi:hypothetical protein